MARERLKQSSLPETFSQVLGDLADLFRKELRLARAELSSNASAKLGAVFGLLWLAYLVWRPLLLSWVRSSLGSQA